MHLVMNEEITLKAGASLDDTNRDKFKVSPIAEIKWTKKMRNLSETSTYPILNHQVLGYGAIGGNDSGTFQEYSISSSRDFKNH